VNIFREKIAAVHRVDAKLLAVGLFWLALVGLLCWRFQGAALDDMFISYRYAWNLSEGHGFTFNPGERVYGISDPGVALLLAGVAAATGAEVPLLGTLLMGLALLAAGLVVLAAGSKNDRFWEAAGGGTLALTSSYLWLGQGSGPMVALALLLVAAALVVREHPAWAGAFSGVLAGFAVWCRPESLIGCAILAVVLLRKPREALAFGASAASLGAMGAALGGWYFGRVMPSTLGVKRQFAALDPDQFTGWTGFWRNALEHFFVSEGRAGRLILVVGLLGLVPLFLRMGRVGRFLTVYGVAQIVLYSFLKVPFFIWYVGPPAFLVLVAVGFAVGEASRFVAARAGRLPALAVALLLTAGLGASAAAARVGWYRVGGGKDWRSVAYAEVGRWIAANTPEGSSVAFDEIGILGFHSERKILDLIGLVSPGAIPYAAVNDQVGAFLAEPTSHVVFHTFHRRGGTRPIVSRPWFPGAYREAARLDFPALGGGSATIFERRPKAVVPPARPPFDKRMRGSS
jgi:hypothetical protein